MPRTANCFYSVLRVVARRRIEDSPLARQQAAAGRGSVGDVVDIADDLVWVDFGGNCILACAPDEIAPHRGA